jgi:hypothetical protein
MPLAELKDMKNLVRMRDRGKASIARRIVKDCSRSVGMFATHGNRL